MKTPTKKQLQELAVRALGEGARVEITRPGRYGHATPPCWYAEAWNMATPPAVNLWADSNEAARRGLAAALAALAEVRK